MPVVVWFVCHLSLDEEPLRSVETLQMLPTSTWYVTAEEFRVAVSWAPLET
jgi:hypothetical protein